jgi:signal transduction histidine kinase
MLTVKECLNNILKHAEATAVELKVDLGNQLHINIRDNGKGFEPVEHAGMGKGLRTTVKRMESVGGSIQWHRNPEGGMTVTLLAPLP